MSHSTIFVLSFLVSGLAGLAALFRVKKEVDIWIVFSSFINSGLLGLSIALLWITIGEYL